MQEVTLSLAAAKDISLDAAAMAVLSALGGIFKLGTAPKAFSRWKRGFHFSSDSCRQDFHYTLQADTG